MAKLEEVDFPDFHNVLESYHSESDRAAAVLAGSYLENQIGLFLRVIMVDDNKKDEWFSSNGPFATFEQRITTAYAFKLISKQARNNFNNIRHIRNRFAHHPSVIDFDDDKVSSHISNLILPEPHFEDKEDSKRDKYILAISLAVSSMQSYVNKRKKIHRSSDIDVTP